MYLYIGIRRTDNSPLGSDKCVVRVIEEWNLRSRDCVEDVIDQTFELKLRHDIHNRSMAFEWGYPGAGPGQLAIAILAHHFDEFCELRPREVFARTWQYYGDFNNLTRQLPRKTGKSSESTIEWMMNTADIKTWLEKNGEKNKEGYESALDTYDWRRHNR